MRMKSAAASRNRRQAAPLRVGHWAGLANSGEGYRRRRGRRHCTLRRGRRVMRHVLGSVPCRYWVSTSLGPRYAPGSSAETPGSRGSGVRDSGGGGPSARHVSRSATGPTSSLPDVGRPAFRRLSDPRVHHAGTRRACSDCDNGAEANGPWACMRRPPLAAAPSRDTHTGHVGGR